MNGFQKFLSLGMPAGRVAGISIRIHFLLIIYAIFRVWELRDIGLFFSISFIAGLYICILLHEFGHALSARWCGGECDEILLWPLGGLAYCRPPLNPTPHLITTLCGPAVTLILWGLLSAVTWLIRPESLTEASTTHLWTWLWVEALADLNLFLLLFNLIPSFPMDGGRALRDTLWHFMPIQKANRIAAVVGVIACIGIISWGVSSGNQMMVFIGIFAIFQGAREMEAYQHVEPWQIESWSLSERFGMAGIRRKARAVDRARGKEKASRYQAKMVPRLEVSEDRRPVEKVDAILEKISRFGMNSITPEERRELERASTELKRQDG